MDDGMGCPCPDSLNSSDRARVKAKKCKSLVMIVSVAHLRKRVLANIMGV